MKNLALTVILVFSLGILSLNAQSGETDILMTINGKEVTKAEFVRIYKKNNNSSNVLDQKALDDYLELFVNFKLKVSEAELLGLDTVKSFISELAGYRKQLAKPYLVDQKIDDQLIVEAYDRLKYDVKASHILINVASNASDEVEQKAHDKAISLRNEIVKGAPFDKVARRESGDKSAKKNGGDLGYFSGFQMVYPFETAAYNTKVGEISMPVKTRFGYHLIKVVDKRPSVGKISVSHIMLSVAPEDGKGADVKARAEIEKIYKRLEAGEEFAVLAKDLSDDKGSAVKGGELPEFGSGRMIPEFETAAFSLESPGDYSKPIKTIYGYHIIKLNKRTGLKSFDEMKQELKSKISKDSRSNQSRESLIENLKVEYSFSENEIAVNSYYKYVTDSILSGTWDGASASHLKDILFTLDGKEYFANNFTDFLLSKKMKVVNESVQHVVTRIHKKWVDNIIISLEDSKLEEKYPDFRYLMNEYHDGILLFELSDEIVWTKAVKDTSGLDNFFMNHRNDYMWDVRLDASVYTLTTDDNAGKLSSKSYSDLNKEAVPKLKKLIVKRLKKKYSVDNMNKRIAKVINKTGSNYIIDIEDDKFSKGDSKLIDGIDWKQGLVDLNEENELSTVIMVNEVLKPEPKELKDSKGQVTADYQTFLEKEWIKELRAKADIVINKEVYKSIK